MILRLGPILPNLRFQGVFPFILTISCCRPKWGGNYIKHRGFYVVATPGGRSVASQMSKMCVLPLFSVHFRHCVLSADMGWQLHKNLGVLCSCHPRGGKGSHVEIPFGRILTTFSSILVLFFFYEPWRERRRSAL